jgi:hypothetical protein
MIFPKTVSSLLDAYLQQIKNLSLAFLDKSTHIPGRFPFHLRPGSSGGVQTRLRPCHHRAPHRPFDLGYAFLDEQTLGGKAPGYGRPLPVVGSAGWAWQAGEIPVHPREQAGYGTPCGPSCLLGPHFLPGGVIRKEIKSANYLLTDRAGRLR